MEKHEHTDDEIAALSLPEDDLLAAALEWGMEGGRGGNFLLMKVENTSQEREQLLRSHGYEVLRFERITEEDLGLLMCLFEVAQSYTMKNLHENPIKIPQDLPQGKVALIFTEAAWTELARNKKVFNAYQGNNAYMDLIGFARRPQNLD